MGLGIGRGLTVRAVFSHGRCPTVWLGISFSDYSTFKGDPASFVMLCGIV
jgi:hypothetical protein